MEDFMRFSYRAALALLLVAGSTIASHAHTTTFIVLLSGISESPPNASPATGVATMTLDMDLITLRVQAEFSGLIGTTMAAHIHAPTLVSFDGTAGVATQVPSFAGFPLGVTNGTYDNTFDLALASSYNPAFIALHGGDVSAALQALHDAMHQGKAYLNIHTSAFQGGEIRGFLVDASAPEPASLGLLGIGLGLGAVVLRRRKNAS
jgi:hypothetical protein